MSIFNIFQNSNEKENKDLSNKKLNVNKSSCPQNHSCPAIRVCPVGALTQKGYAAPKVDLDKCIKCGKCTKLCPMRALLFE
ncbi:MAG: 4Fe-4S binding protein [Sedimentibacter sp.]